MAVKPYKEGAVWSFRLRIKGQAIYRTGFASPAIAARECESLRQKILDGGKPKHDGPWRTNLAQGFQRYALERLPFLKGARQDANRINRYLRAANIPVIEISTPDPAEKLPSVYWTVTLSTAAQVRKIPKGLTAHREELAARAATTDHQIHQLANMPVAEISAYHVQELIDTMQRAGSKAATVSLERALIRQFYNYARKNWQWIEPVRNPATHLNMPKIDNARDRVLTNDEWRRVSLALEKSRNRYAAPALALLLETGMRVSEPLIHATWADVDFGRNLMRLSDAKAGARDVPLNPAAVDILRFLEAMRPADSVDMRILPVTYEALKAAWRRACEAAELEDVHIHDLRHTAATRFALELNGNLPVLKVITGHKTYSQLARYINIKPVDVARLLHGCPMTDNEAPAGSRASQSVVAEMSSESIGVENTLPANVVPFRRRASVPESVPISERSHHLQQEGGPNQ